MDRTNCFSEYLPIVQSRAGWEVSLCANTHIQDERAECHSIIAEHIRPGGASYSTQILSTRQTQVLQLIAEGKTTKQIALSLNISPKTVETHRAQLMERLDIHDVAGLVRYALKTGLVKID